MDKQETPTTQRVAVLERQFQDFAANVTTFIQSQQAENQRLYNAIGDSGKQLFSAFEKLQGELSSRGKVTGQFVLSLIAVGVSLLVGTCGFVRAYVAGQVEPVKAEMVQNFTHLMQITEGNLLKIKEVEVAGTTNRLAITAHTAADEATKQSSERELTRLRKDVDDARDYEISSLRAFRDKTIKTP